jgi:hypothetical protein
MAPRLPRRTTRPGGKKLGGAEELGHAHTEGVSEGDQDDDGELNGASALDLLEVLRVDASA